MDEASETARDKTAPTPTRRPTPAATRARTGRAALRKTPVDQALGRDPAALPERGTGQATLADLFGHRFPSGSMCRILLAAIDCFSKKGFHASSTRDIARKAKLSPSAVYIHFRSKEEVLFAISLVAAEWARDRLVEAAERGGTPTERLRRFVAAQVNCHASLRMAMYVANYEFQSLNTQQRRKVIEVRDAIEGLLSDCLNAGVAEGEFRIADVAMARVAIQSLCVSVLNWYSPKGSLSASELGELYADLVGGMVGVAPAALGKAA